jgi:hypothetical protein
LGKKEKEKKKKEREREWPDSSTPLIKLIIDAPVYLPT